LNVNQIPTTETFFKIPAPLGTEKNNLYPADPHDAVPGKEKIMGVEIERKFILTGDEWRSLSRGTAYRQGYLNSQKERTVRVRTIDDKGFLTIKGISVGATRMEYEYEIPVEDANVLLDELCEKPLIEKKRYKIDFGGFVWEVDEFFGENEGLIVAEIELESEDQTFDKPSWVGDEVSGDSRYFNSNLIQHPYSSWDK
jgi:CYTH domain-containing protein